MGYAYDFMFVVTMVFLLLVVVPVIGQLVLYLGYRVTGGKKSFRWYMFHS